MTSLETSSQIANLPSVENTLEQPLRNDIISNHSESTEPLSGIQNDSIHEETNPTEESADRRLSSDGVSDANNQPCTATEYNVEHESCALTNSNITTGQNASDVKDDDGSLTDLNVVKSWNQNQPTNFIGSECELSVNDSFKTTKASAVSSTPKHGLSSTDSNIAHRSGNF